MRVCREYCNRHNIAVTSTYIDRAKSASHGVAKRTEFLQMIADSAKHQFDAVIVYKLDRFARNRYDSANYKAKLKKNGVKLISATENLTDTPESIILESVLEGMAEFYSAELSQKIKRGFTESAHKHKVIGGVVPLGYKFIDKQYIVDESTVAIVQEAFRRYADGETIADITKSFNQKGYRTAKGAEFTHNSFHRMFTNKRYLGYYIYKDYEAEGVLPQIIDQNTWDRVQMRVEQNRRMPAHSKADDLYILTGKLYCGHCGKTMIGESGTGKGGNVYRYYKCLGRKKKNSCDKKPVPKEWIENVVVDLAKEMLTDEMIEQMAEMAVAENDRILAENAEVRTLTERLADIEKRISNISKAVEAAGVFPETLVNRIAELEKEKTLTKKALAEAEKMQIHLTVPQVVFWLSKFKDNDYEDENFRRQLVDMLINTVVIWDDPEGQKITVAYNLTNKKSKTITVSDLMCSDNLANVDYWTPNPNTLGVILQTKVISCTSLQASRSASRRCRQR